MINYLKFSFIFLFELIKRNPVKLILIIVASICFTFAGTIKDSTSKYVILKETKVENEHIYIYKHIINDEYKYEILYSYKPIPSKNGVIYLKSYNEFNYLLWIAFSIIVFILIVAFFIGISDDDVSWEIETCWEEAFSTLIYCEEENGNFYYFALGRLIQKRNNQIGRFSTASRELKIYGFRDLYRCPKYQTKKHRRESLLNEIGIK